MAFAFLPSGVEVPEALQGIEVGEGYRQERQFAVDTTLSTTYCTATQLQWCNGQLLMCSGNVCSLMDPYGQLLQQVAIPLPQGVGLATALMCSRVHAAENQVAINLRRTWVNCKALARAARARPVCPVSEQLTRTDFPFFEHIVSIAYPFASALLVALDTNGTIHFYDHLDDHSSMVRM